MRRRTSAASRAVALAALIAPASIAGQAPGPGSAVLVRPPAEVSPPSSTPMATQPTSPAPSVPPPAPGPGPATTPPIGVPGRAGGPWLAIDPAAGTPPRPASTTASRPNRDWSPFDGIGPEIPGGPASPDSATIGEGPPVVVRPPLGGSPTATGIGPLVLSPSIAPPLSGRDDDGPTANPLLPPGPDRDRRGRDDEGRDGDGDGDGDDRVPRSRGDSTRTAADRGRPGLLGGVFGRLFGAAPPPPPTPASRFGGTDGSVTGLPGEPASEEAIRRDLERRIAAGAGDRLSSLEVLIVGPRVHIRAQATRFWQRRPLKRDLEAIPMPPGFRSSVEVR
ncbi:hypothetical protein [Tautonia plasticadhaerens]|uniref:Uncharacterized protein n=1 Tax=Tautonia plasticadhaerens TaxID=2527974 RepID=A0A518HAS5_9BACT|nr:hypothetical protein [Tautonia plasticadhaerens]QDV37952.1 hypothetical protein ElP_58990 [Tautonia plasticadhaerens]